MAGTLMVEPTESGDLGGIDRFLSAMASTRAGIEQGVLPAPELRHKKHSPTAGRIDGAAGGRSPARPTPEAFEH